MKNEMIDTTNKFLVCTKTIVGVNLTSQAHFILRPPKFMTSDDALLLAAYLVCLADGNASNRFTEVLEAVQNT